MQLHYHLQPGGNFGDDLNTWIWNSLIPGWCDWDDDVTLFGVGTLLQAHRLEPYLDKRILVLGSGVGYGPLPLLPLPSQWDIRCVRGPRSAQALNIDKKYGLIDPAVLLPDIQEFACVEKSTVPIFIPHHSSADRHNWDQSCYEADAEFVSPMGDPKEVIKRIVAAPLVIAESMHAAIIADAFRVPWVPVKISPHFNGDKWLDWADSLQLDIKIPPLFTQVDAIDKCFPIFRYRNFRRKMRLQSENYFVTRSLRNAIYRQQRFLSDSSALEVKKSQLNAIFSEVIQDYS